jgi:hypothetical protein
MCPASPSTDSAQLRSLRVHNLANFAVYGRIPGWFWYLIWVRTKFAELAGSIPAGTTPKEQFRGDFTAPIRPPGLSGVYAASRAVFAGCRCPTGGHCGGMSDDWVQPGNRFYPDGISNYPTKPSLM